MSILGINMISATTTAVTTTAPLLFAGFLLAASPSPGLSLSSEIGLPGVASFEQDPPRPDQVLERMRIGRGHDRPITQVFSDNYPGVQPLHERPYVSPVTSLRKNIGLLVYGTLLGIFLTMLINVLRRQVAIRNNEKAVQAYQNQDYEQAAKLWLKIGFYPDAIRVYEQVIRNKISDSDLFDLYLKAVKMRFIQHDYRTALHYYEAAIALKQKESPSTPKDHRDIARLYSLAADMALRQKDFERAEQHYQKSADHYEQGAAPIRASIAKRKAKESEGAKINEVRDAVAQALKKADAAAKGDGEKGGGGTTDGGNDGGEIFH